MQGGGGVRMLRVPNFVKNYTIGCTNLQIIILLGMLFLYMYTKVYVQKLLKLLACHAGLKNKL